MDRDIQIALYQQVINFERNDERVKHDEHVIEKAIDLYQNAIHDGFDRKQAIEIYQKRLMKEMFLP